jgi:putative hydrolase of the HAD superfamily
VEKDYRFLDIFDVAVFSAEVKLAKPDPKIYELALAKLAVNAEEAVFVDDVSDNIEAARAVGMHGIQFKTVNQVLSELNALLNTGVAG